MQKTMQPNSKASAATEGRGQNNSEENDDMQRGPTTFSIGAHTQAGDCLLVRQSFRSYSFPDMKLLMILCSRTSNIQPNPPALLLVFLLQLLLLRRRPFGGSPNNHDRQPSNISSFLNPIMLQWPCRRTRRNL